MSESTPSRSIASNEQYKTRLRSYQTQIVLRKSPRFHPQSENLTLTTPKTVNKPSISTNLTQSSVLAKSRKGRLTKCSTVTPLRSIENFDGSSKKNAKHGRIIELSHDGKEKRRSSRISEKENVDGGKCKKVGKEGSGCRSEKRRPLQSIGKENVDEKSVFYKDECKKEKRGSSRVNRNENTRSEDSCKSTGCKKKKPRGKHNLNANELNDEFECKKEKWLMYSKKAVDYNENVKSDELSDENDNVDSDLNVPEDGNISDILSDQSKISVGVEVSKKRNREMIHKREIDSVPAKEGHYSGLAEWSQEQDFALQKAYLVANPSPHFWKKVARMVPGKSAQECFDRVNNSLSTPPHPQPRSKAKKSHCMSPIASFSLTDNKPIIPPNTTVRKSSNKKKSLVAQKTVRHLLRKHTADDQNQEADYFSVLETSPVQLVMLSPDANSTIISPQGISSCSHNKRLSRFAKSNDPSPVVLKKIKNMALHEKYIDQLHNREARRKYDACSSRVVKGEAEVDDKSGIVKAAKSALISEAQEVIVQFKQSQANLLDISADDEVDYDVDNEEGYDDDDDEDDK